MKLMKPYTNKEYADMAVYCNHHNCHMEDKGNYLETEPNPVIVETYVQKRLKEYPAISDQLDMIYWDKVNGTNLWQAKITEIKNKYPKE